MTSNFGYICLYISLILLMYEVDKDMEAADDFTDFLKQVEAYGNKYSVRNAAGMSGDVTVDENHDDIEMDKRNDGVISEQILR
eukprot:CAMPEP_0172522682 /NCGR_PEP_ID=MMETSP1066-20121228/293262_1 /TAXON_ID=671091 /ORGANISM="Coscinodiscus wailesii, Strain CCMP2513" /LENGTH=82 /DNA_ID=CAMNT_0013305711 /DNA_START=956 /DNA_END=1204 /DNA_ORIENTATION=+